MGASVGPSDNLPVDGRVPVSIARDLRPSTLSLQSDAVLPRGVASDSRSRVVLCLGLRRRSDLDPRALRDCGRRVLDRANDRSDLGDVVGQGQDLQRTGFIDRGNGHHPAGHRDVFDRRPVLFRFAVRQVRPDPGDVAGVGHDPVPRQTRVQISGICV